MCYRRADSEEMVDRIYDALAARFGEAAVFRDIDTIPPGVDFPTYIQESLRDCPVTLVFIGKEWTACADARGRRRIDDPGDHVRIEVETALALPGARVIPVFVRRAEVPGEDELPESLRALRRRNGITVRSSGADYKHDIAHLSDILEEAVNGVLGARQTTAEEQRRKDAEIREREAKEERERELAGRRHVQEDGSAAGEPQRLATQPAFTLRSLAVGQLIAGRFRLEKLLGRGGMGVVWRARDEELRKTRALKFLKEELASDPGAIASLKDELGRCQELAHRHIIRLFELVKDEAHGLVAVSMEVAEGGSLTARRLETPHRWFEPDELLPWVGQLCEALAYIHEEAGLVHRDIKPSNLLLDERDRLKLSDFGISGSLTESFTRLTGEHPSAGTPAYMSPEQACGKAPHPSDDLYALGATLYELLSGQPPFSGSAASVRAQLLSDTPPPAISVRRSLLEKLETPVPPLWENIVAALLAKNAADRPASAREVMERLRVTEQKPEAPPAMAVAVESLPVDEGPEAPPDCRVSADPEDPLKDYEKMETAPAEPEIIPQTAPLAAEKGNSPLGGHAPEQPVSPMGEKGIAARRSSDGAPVVPASTARETPAVEPSRGKKRALVIVVAALALVVLGRIGIRNSPSTSGPASTPLPIPTPAPQPEPTPTPYRAPASRGVAPAKATKDIPFENSLGMKFVPVEITEGPTSGKRVLFSVWDTRVQDYAEYARAKGITPEKSPFEQGPTHPAVMVGWGDAKSFCEWLTNKERVSGRIGGQDEYRLPSDIEWSCAVGIGRRADGRQPRNLYPWGAQWPPPKGAGNYDPSLQVDPFPFTSPAGSFAPNAFGLYDMGGNVWQWCEDFYDAKHENRVLRGASWNGSVEMIMASDERIGNPPTSRVGTFGFRCVLANPAQLTKAKSGKPLFPAPDSAIPPAPSVDAAKLDTPKPATAEAIELQRWNLIAGKHLNDAAVQYIAAGESNSIEDELATYAEVVDFYDEGIKTKEQVRGRLATLRRQWPVRHYSVTKILNSSLDREKNTGTVTVVYTYQLKSGSKAKSGTGTSLIVFADIASTPHVILVKERSDGAK
jgi:serine/threonine protein kinase